MERLLVSIIETEEFIERARKIMTSEQQEDLLLFLARHPEAGDVISDSAAFESSDGLPRDVESAVARG